MDTKTPPIPLKVQEKPKPRYQESVADVSLPPLTPYRNHRQKQKIPGTQWSHNVPSSIRYQDHQKKRPYRYTFCSIDPRIRLEPLFRIGSHFLRASFRKLQHVLIKYIVKSKFCRKVSRKKEKSVIKF